MSGRTSFGSIVATQKAHAESTKERILTAIQTIEREIVERGLYPENKGKVTLTEVARRAGVSAVTLRNKHHHETRGAVQKWLKQLKQRAPTTKATARKVTREKLAWYEDALRKVNAEALKWRAEIAALTEENERLRTQIASMKASNGANVVGIKSRRFER